jgi:putative transposase
MSQSLANVTVHLVFSTKDRRRLLRDQDRGQFHSYITGILKRKESPLIEINSLGDHVHVLYMQSKNHPLAKVVEAVKASSSGWLRRKNRAYSNFAWQAGYAAFSVSQSHLGAVRAYIQGQAEHHKREDFQTEFRRFCKKNGLPLDERYAWD